MTRTYRTYADYRRRALKRLLVGAAKVAGVVAVLVAASLVIVAAWGSQ